MISIKDFSIITSTNLPARATAVIAAAAIEQLEEAGIMRPHTFIDNSPEPGDQVYVPFTFDDQGDAFTRTQGEDWKYDSGGASSDDIDMIEICKGFQIDWNSKVLKNLKVLAGQSKQSINKVKSKEDHEISSVLSGATSSVTAAGVLSGTSADPVKDVAQAIRKVRALGYKANTIFIEQVNYEEITSIIASNDWLRVTEELISRGVLPLWQGLKIQQLKAADLTHGTAYVAHTGPGVDSALWTGEAMPLKEHIFDDDDNHTTKVQHFTKVAPALARPDAVATISGW